MLAKALNLPLMLFDFVQEARQSHFQRFVEKMRVFYTLIGLQIKYSLHKKPGKVVSHRIFGYTVSGYDYGVLLFLFREIFLSGSYYFKTSTKSPVIIDCGANIGMAMLYFKKLYPQARIIAFEPNAGAFALLQKNIADNNLQDVTAINAALSNEKGQMRFYMGANEASVVGSLRADRGLGGEVMVDTTLLSDYLTEHRPDMVKIDVEGAETLILEDLVNTETLPLADRYVIEYHHQIDGEKARLSAFLRTFEANGFNYVLNAPATEPGDYQDVLLHCYRVN